MIRRKAIGDVVTSLEAVRALRERWPAARLEVVVDRIAAPLLCELDWLDELLVYDPPTGWARIVYDLAWWLRLARRRYELVLDLMGTPLTAAWTFAAGRGVRVGRKRRGRAWAYNLLVVRPEGPVRFAGEDFLDCARAAGASAGRWRPVRLLRENTAALRHPPPEGDGPWIIVHPPATWSAKAWPLGSWGELILSLRQAGIERIEISWGPGEESTRDEVLRRARGAAVPMPAVDLVELTRRLSACDLLIAVDSGPVHLAVAQGTPTLTLFGSTDPRGWHPPVEGHRVLFHDVECRPCNLTVCPVEGHPCLDRLEPQEVLQEALSMLRGAKEVSR